MTSLRPWCAAALLTGLAACRVTPASGAVQAAIAGAPVHSEAPLPLAAGRSGAAGTGCGTSCEPHSAGVGPAMGARDASMDPVVIMRDASTDLRSADDAGVEAQPVDRADDAGPAPTADSGVGPSGRPAGVSECYSAASSGHAASQLHWQVIRSGDLARRGDMIEQLTAAVADHPEDEEFALLLGLASLWRVAEPYSLESLDPLLTLDSIETAQSELERAYALCPTDHRIPAWLGPIKIRMGRMLGDAALVDDGFAVLNQGIAHYPAFVLFSKLLVYADLPANDPDFMQALDAVRENARYCGTLATGLAADPACRNHPRASHNIEGSAVFLGDVYAKAQDRAAALAAYQSAKATSTWSTWDYQALLEERIATLDTRMASAMSAGTSDDLEPMWNSQMQCSICHRD